MEMCPGRLLKGEFEACMVQTCLIPIIRTMKVLGQYVLFPLFCHSDPAQFQLSLNEEFLVKSNRFILSNWFGWLCHNRLSKEK